MQRNVIEYLLKTESVYGSKKALADEAGFLTFSEYLHYAKIIASNILEIKNNKPELKNKKQIPVIIYLEKSKEILLSFMGTVISGNFYSPIDVDTPSARAKKIIDVLEPKIVITCSEYKDKVQSLGFNDSNIITIDSSIEESSNNVNKKYLFNIKNDFDEKEINKAIENTIDTDILYVLFTSGSTGNPKGVTICHRSVIDYIDFICDEFNINKEDNFANQSAFHFDNSILEIYSTMKTGATLYIIPKNLFTNVYELLQYLLNNKINTIFWVPSVLVMVSKLDGLSLVDLSKTLKKILFCGEVMPTKHLNYWKGHIKDAIYVNLYGPTEITDACTFYLVDREFNDDDSLPIGWPIRNTDILVFDENNELIVFDSNESKDIRNEKIGELCVRGTSLALGYYNDKEKTDAAFIQNPLVNNVRDIIYKTGDLVKYNEFGELIYIGRKDYQIKYNGNRIELGEIEVAAMAIENISQCAALFEPDKNIIVLFIDYEYNTKYIKEKLKNALPNYMLPQRVIYLKDFPLNINGKIDRIKLKEMI